MTYPGPGQAYLALEEACAALDEGRVDVAIWLAVAHQRNFLVAHHFARLVPPVDVERLRDAGGRASCSRREAHAKASRCEGPRAPRIIECTIHVF